MVTDFPIFGNQMHIKNLEVRYLHDRKQTSMCTNCTEGLKINILEIEQ